MNEENKKCQVWINDGDPEMFELRILMKRDSSKALKEEIQLFLL